MPDAPHTVGSFAEVPDGKLWVEEAGQGPTVVLVHFGIADRRMWDEQLVALADDHHLVRYDQRGYGRSPAPTQPFSYVADLDAVLDHVRAERAVLVGGSVGGATIIDYALEHPERVGGLVPVAAGLSGYPWQPTPAVRAFEDAVASDDPARTVEAAYAAWAPLPADPDTDRRMRELLVDNLPGLRTLGRFWTDQRPAYGRLHQINAPTLVVVGEDDQPDFRHIADHLAEQIPDAQLVVLRGVDHNVPLRAGTELNRLLARFLTRLGVSAPARTAADSATVNALREVWSRRSYSTTEFSRAAIRMLANGRPVTPHALAEATGRYVEEVQADIEEARQSGVEVDDGNVVGAALTLRPTPHRFRVYGHDLYTWCGFDALFLPLILGERAEVASTCAVTGTAIQLTVQPDGAVSHVTPSGTVVAIVDDDVLSCCPTTGPESDICTQMPFFASREAGERWAGDHPGARILDLDDARTVARSYVDGQPTGQPG
ncbi:MAG: alpha/beta fold hydrolase [Micromonosporaceae bacterium]